MKFVVYDIETLCNLFIACFKDCETGKIRKFVIHEDSPDIGQLYELIKFLGSLRKHRYALVGFNNVRFDWQVMQYIWDNYKNWQEYCPQEIIDEIYGKAQELINNQDDVDFRLIPQRNFKILNIDVFKQKHYDGKAKRGTSLKWIEYTTRYHNVEEMPFPHNMRLDWKQVDDVVDYCLNDVDATYKFFSLIKFETDLRQKLEETYKIPLLNASEPRMVRDILSVFLCEKMGITDAQLREMKTFRKNIHFKDILFPYLKFETKELQNIHKLISSVKLDASPQSTQKFEHHFVYKGIPIDLGLGGIHGCIKPGVYNASDDWVMLDVDVVSFYPNLGIRNRIKPAHLPETFIEVQEWFFNERKKIPKKDPINYIYKIILNSIYGLSKEINGYLYDPLYTYSITVNGQLTLLMLAEMLYTRIPELVAYQYNTDGVTIGFPKKYMEEVEKICKEWQELTKLELEQVEYEKMVIADVNTYLGVYKDKSKGIKRVGRFEYEMKPAGKIDYNNNPSFLIIPKAIEQYFVYGVDYKEYIRNHKDVYDFLAATRKKSDFDLNLYKLNNDKLTKEKQQKVTRYLIAEKCPESGMLVKDYVDGKLKGRQVAAVADYPVYIMNKIENNDATTYPIDYAYYIHEVSKEIFCVEGNKNQLTLF